MDIFECRGAPHGKLQTSIGLDLVKKRFFKNDVMTNLLSLGIGCLAIQQDSRNEYCSKLRLCHFCKSAFND